MSLIFLPHCSAARRQRERPAATRKSRTDALMRRAQKNPGGVEAPGGDTIRTIGCDWELTREAWENASANRGRTEYGGTACGHRGGWCGGADRIACPGAAVGALHHGQWRCAGGRLDCGIAERGRRVRS